MRRTILSLAAAATIASTAALLPTRADAMSVGTAAAIEAAVADMGMLEDVRYVCRHRGYSSRRVCWWQPGRGYYRPYRGWRGGWRGGRRWR